MCATTELYTKIRLIFFCGKNIVVILVRFEIEILTNEVSLKSYYKMSLAEYSSRKFLTSGQAFSFRLKE